MNKFLAAALTRIRRNRLPCMTRTDFQDPLLTHMVATTKQALDSAPFNAITLRVYKAWQDAGRP